MSDEPKRYRQRRGAADRIRVEIEIDGETVAYELRADGEKIPFGLEIEQDVRELPPTGFGWRQFEPGGNFRIKLDAAGRQITRETPEGVDHG
jgi:hypothetical protein